MNFGFQKETICPDHYILGGLSKVPRVVYQPNGDWRSFLPKYEPQAENYETWGCAVWGTQNAIEILFKRVFGRQGKA